MSYSQRTSAEDLLLPASSYLKGSNPAHFKLLQKRTCSSSTLKHGRYTPKKTYNRANSSPTLNSASSCLALESSSTTYALQSAYDLRALPSQMSSRIHASASMDATVISEPVKGNNSNTDHKHEANYSIIPISTRKVSGQIYLQQPPISPTIDPSPVQLSECQIDEDDLESLPNTSPASFSSIISAYLSSVYSVSDLDLSKFTLLPQFTQPEELHDTSTDTCFSQSEQTDLCTKVTGESHDSKITSIPKYLEPSIDGLVGHRDPMATSSLKRTTVPGLSSIEMTRSKSPSLGPHVMWKDPFIRSTSDSKSDLEVEPFSSPPLPPLPPLSPAARRTFTESKRASLPYQLNFSQAENYVSPPPKLKSTEKEVFPPTNILVTPTIPLLSRSSTFTASLPSSPTNQLHTFAPTPRDLPTNGFCPFCDVYHPANGCPATFPLPPKTESAPLFDRHRSLNLESSLFRFSQPDHPSQARHSVYYPSTKLNKPLPPLPLHPLGFSDSRPKTVENNAHSSSKVKPTTSAPRANSEVSSGMSLLKSHRQVSVTSSTQTLTSAGPSTAASNSSLKTSKRPHFFRRLFGGGNSNNVPTVPTRAKTSMANMRSPVEPAFPITATPSNTSGKSASTITHEVSKPQSKVSYHQILHEIEIFLVSFLLFLNCFF